MDLFRATMELRTAKDINFDHNEKYFVFDWRKKRFPIHSYIIAWVLAMLNFSVAIALTVQMFLVGFKNFYPDEIVKYLVFAVPAVIYVPGLLLKMRFLLIPMMLVYMGITVFIFFLAFCSLVNAFFPPVFAHFYHTNPHRYDEFVHSHEERAFILCVSIVGFFVCILCSIFFLGSLHVMRKVFNYLRILKYNGGPTYMGTSKIDKKLPTADAELSPIEEED